MRYHPEQKENEIYMGNVHLKIKHPYFSVWDNQTSWQSNRYGNISYSNVGEKLDNNYYPWFITIEEVQSEINNLKWEIENIPCTWNKSKLETIAIYERMINDRSVFDN